MDANKPINQRTIGMSTFEKITVGHLTNGSTGIGGLILQIVLQVRPFLGEQVVYAQLLYDAPQLFTVNR